jgi:N-acyl-phosphatidylethanolamine-hydrolysing phospholipase D
MPKSIARPLKYCGSSYQIKSALTAFIYTTLLASLLGCANARAQYNPAKPHHTPEGFKNNYADNVNKTGRDFLRWQYERTQAGLPKPPQTPTATVPPDTAFIHANAKPAAMQPAITWVGHATMLVQAGGLNVLTDPIFSDRASPVQLVGPKRAQPPGLSMAQLPPIDVVLVSHNHYDHLDKNSALALSNIAGAATLFIVPLGVKKWFESLGISNAKELDWWDSATVKGVEFHFTPVQHWSARGLGDRSQTLWGGWSVFAPDLHWYFSGDTGYSKDFVDTQQRFAPRQTAALGGGFDIALLAVGAYEPRWFMKGQHINPAEAVQIHQDLKAKRSVGVHWGTFELTDEPLDQPLKDLAAARTAAGVPEADFFLLAVGETRKLPARRGRVD